MMKPNRALGVSLVLAVMVVAAPVAIAKPLASTAPRGSQIVAPLPKAATLAGADSSGTSTLARQLAQVVEPVPVQPVPVAAPRQQVVHADVSPSRNYVATIAVSALMGGLAGGLIGGAIYYLDNQDNWRNIAYWAAGGVLVGAGVGVIQVMVEESRASAISSRLPSDPAPTFRTALYTKRF